MKGKASGSYGLSPAYAAAKATRNPLTITGVPYAGLWGSRTRLPYVICVLGGGLVLVDQTAEDRLAPDHAVKRFGGQQAIAGVADADAALDAAAGC
jgi:hypothetical protein